MSDHIVLSSKKYVLLLYLKSCRLATVFRRRRMWLEKSRLFHTGRQIPLVGLGTFQLRGDECVDAVKHALKCGYRLIDTARIYKNELEIAEAISGSGIPRAELFITSKISPYEQGEEKAYAAVNSALVNLKTDYLDLVLIHWPGVSKMPPDSAENGRLRVGSWKALMRAKDEGLVRDIGVSNFLVRHLVNLVEEIEGNDIPVLNQIELHPHCTQEDICRYCELHGIVVQAYSSLGSSGAGCDSLMTDPVVVSIAEQKKMSPSEVLLLWATQQNICIIPKSKSKDRLQMNSLSRFGSCGGDILLLADEEGRDHLGLLSEKDIQALSECNKNRHYCWDSNKIQ